MWRCNQLLSGFLAKGHLPRVSRQSRRSLNAFKPTSLRRGLGFKDLIQMYFGGGTCDEVLPTIPPNFNLRKTFKQQTSCILQLSDIGRRTESKSHNLIIIHFRLILSFYHICGFGGFRGFFKYQDKFGGSPLTCVQQSAGSYSKENTG